MVALAVDGSTSGPRQLDTGLEVENPIAIVPGPAGNPWILTLGGEVLELGTVGGP